MTILRLLICGSGSLTEKGSRPIALGVAIVVALLLPASSCGEAQAASTIPRVGFLRTAAPPDAYVDAFRQSLKERGYVEGKNIAFEYRWADGTTQRLPELAAELVRIRVDVVVTDGTLPALAAKKASNTIPIVMASSGDPVGTGLVASLARPSGNITGLTSINAELGSKLLGILKEFIPNLTHVAVFGPTDSPIDDLFATHTEAVARTLGLKFTSLRFRGPGDYERLFRRAVNERAHALIVRGTPFTSAAHREEIVKLAAKNGLPAIYETRDWADRGGLMSYGADRIDMYRRAAIYVDKILKGARPADLPVEQPIKFEFVVNLKAAKTLGRTIPPSLLSGADQVIE